jgi:hypothetical protein
VVGGGGIVGGGGVGATVSVQNTSTILDEQAEGVTAESVTIGVEISAMTIVESGAVPGVVSVCSVVGVGVISGTALEVWEGPIGDGLSSLLHGRYTCVVILTISLSVQIKSVELG